MKKERFSQLRIRSYDAIKIVNFNGSSTMECTCPSCKEKVNAIKISQNRRPIPDTFNFRYTLHILGCPECKNVFFEKEIDPQLKEDLKEKGINI